MISNRGAKPLPRTTRAFNIINISISSGIKVTFRTFKGASSVRNALYKLYHLPPNDLICHVIVNVIVRAVHRGSKDRPYREGRRDGCIPYRHTDYIRIVNGCPHNAVIGDHLRRLPFILGVAKGGGHLAGAGRDMEALVWDWVIREMLSLYLLVALSAKW